MSKKKPKKIDWFKKGRIIPVKQVPYREIKAILDKHDANRHKKN